MTEEFRSFSIRSCWRNASRGRPTRDRAQNQQSGPTGKKAEERKAKETGHCVTTPRLALTVCWLAFIF